MATKIEWTERVWNPVTGCTPRSEGCFNCYAKTMALRLKGMGQKKYANGFTPTIHHEALKEPYEWKHGMVFVCSMSDLFHDDVPFSFIKKVMETIQDNPQCTFQVLTKRAERMAEFFTYEYEVPKNVWLGVSCESAKHYGRIFHLKRIIANVRFVSCEPLLGDMRDITLDGIDWLITGGECSNRARRPSPDWFRVLRDRCIDTNTAFFFKQWGTWGEDGVKRSKYKNGSLLDGREWKQLPNL